ncbi:uL13 family ribosomal protein [Candidatus Kaiserbacteria bacterium]|nr:uL13 family ribosomal protein [Candidatus Kaiserbacteria bacterium]
MQTEHTIDAAGQSLGRVAANAAKALMGKMRADYTPNKLSSVKVTIKNTAKLILSESKLTGKIFQNYSGYPGGRRDETLGNLTSRKGRAAAVKLAITRMLPRNTMRTARLKNLVIEE